ncbi:hypothetical protein FZO89_16130 [Luteimonas viscosa]|uniref:Uncharacterized protein n=1 Tax=Luteimonas viscosa TaxID=1132694 RepID=A0A5D4XM50_9GAMM|nr:hypothetical protein [Luteimonas viscosa]TYT23750.1 hypothetical protein FZO89_16130 [Luteimonas viscosa]
MNGLWTARIAASCIATLLSAPLGAQDSPGTAFADGAAVDLAAGSWDGRYHFPGVYCATFPIAERATRRISALFSGSAVSLVRVEYGAPIEVYLVSSTMPASLTAGDEHAAQLASARAFAASLPHLYRVEESASPMGPMLRKSMTNVTHPASDQDPFPLAMRFVDAPGEVRTVAESRLFARSPDRFEVVAVAGLRAGATPREIELVRELVSTFADDLTASLQDCTATMPRRTR